MNKITCYSFIIIVCSFLIYDTYIVNTRLVQMDIKLKNLIKQSLQIFTQNTGIKAVHQAKVAKSKAFFPDGLVRVNYQDNQWEFKAIAKTRVNRATVAMEIAQLRPEKQDSILITGYTTPPLADLMKANGLFFMDTAGNAYIDKPPLFVYIKGNKPAKKTKTTVPRRLFKPAGLKVVFALLNVPDMVSWSYRKIAVTADVALGTVDWTFRDLKEMGFLIEMGKGNRRLTKLSILMQRWIEAYPDQLRPKLIIDQFMADNFEWWKDAAIADYDACWGGEVAAANITKQLKPANVTIYSHKIPGKLIIAHKLRKAADGNIEILKPFWKFAHEFTQDGFVPPLLVYADLMATGDDRNIKTAGIIYDRFLTRFERQD